MQHVPSLDAICPPRAHPTPWPRPCSCGTGTRRPGRAHLASCLIQAACSLQNDYDEIEDLEDLDEDDAARRVDGGRLALAGFGWLWGWWLAVGLVAGCGLAARHQHGSHVGRPRSQAESLT